MAVFYHFHYFHMVLLCIILSLVVFLDDRQMKVVRLLALSTGRISPQQTPLLVISVRV